MGRCWRRSDSGPASLRQAHAAASRRLGVVVAGLVIAVAPVMVGALGAGPAGAQSTSTGSVTGFGDATPYGVPTGSQLNAPVVGMVSTPGGYGYWLVATGAGREFAMISFTYADPAAPGGSFTETGVAPTSAG